MTNAQVYGIDVMGYATLALIVTRLMTYQPVRMPLWRGEPSRPSATSRLLSIHTMSYPLHHHISTPATICTTTYLLRLSAARPGNPPLMMSLDLPQAGPPHHHHPVQPHHQLFCHQNKRPRLASQLACFLRRNQYSAERVGLPALDWAVESDDDGCSGVRGIRYFAYISQLLTSWARRGIESE